MSASMHTYKGYKITTTCGPAPDYANPTAKVFDPNNKRGSAIFVTTSLDRAVRWIDTAIDEKAVKVATK